MPQADAPDRTHPPEPALQEQPPSRLEWLLAAAGAAMVLGSAGVLVAQAVGEQAHAPSPQLQVLQVERREPYWLLHLQVRNLARDAAQDLRVVGELHRAGEVVERAETTFEFLAGGSVREAGMFFRNDPARHEVVLRAESYQKP